MIDFIINSFAGGKDGKKAKKTIKKIENRLNERCIDYTLHVTNQPKQATLLTDELIKKGVTKIVVVGGDGTLHEVINGFSNFENVNLGIIPCGTGNDFVNSIHLPLDPIKALDLILDGEAKYTDYMQMPTIRGLNIIGMGIDVNVLKEYAKSKKKTSFTYTLALIKALQKFNYIDFDAEINGEKKNYKSFMACIANGFRYGGGLRICPIADATDNQLDFVTIREMKKIKIIKAFTALKSGKILSLPEVSHQNMQEIKIYPKGDYTVNVDGELYENIPFEVKIISNQLKIYRP